MLHTPERTFAARRRLLSEVEAGRITEVEACHQLLELDPDDFVSLIRLGRAQMNAGDHDGARESFWRAVNAQPLDPGGYYSLAMLDRETDEALSDALCELGMRKQILSGDLPEDQTMLPEALAEVPEIAELSAMERLEAMAEVLCGNRDTEPPEVTARLRSYRLLHELQERPELDSAIVDELIAEGRALTPLLIGVLRAWVQSYVDEEESTTVERALAILGMQDDLSMLPHVLEMTDDDLPEIAGSAGWALDRLIASNPAEAGRILEVHAPTFDYGLRIILMEHLVRYPAMDPEGRLSKALGSNLARLTREDRARFYPILLPFVAVTINGGEAIAKEMLRLNSAQISRKTRAECEYLLEAVRGQTPPPLSSAPGAGYTVYDICAGEAYWEEEGEDEYDEDDDEYLDEDDDLDLIPEPVHVEPRLGRNDPCWCGSGKKYKKCHLDADERPTQAPSSPTDPYSRLQALLLASVRDLLTREEFARHLREFAGGSANAEQTEALFDWFVHDWIVPQLNRTVIDEYLHRHATSVTDTDRAILEQWAASYCTLYEVQEVAEGKGVALKDLFSGQEIFVHDVATSKSVVRWDILFTRVVPGARGLELASLVLLVPRTAFEELREWMEKDNADQAPWPEYLKQNALRIRRRANELGQERADSLRLSNTDGEPLVLSKAHFTTSDSKALAAAFRALTHVVEEEPEAKYVWLVDASKEGSTILGHIAMRGKQVTLECNSRERLARGRTLLLAAAGPLLKHVRDEYKSQDHLMKAVGKAGPSKPSGPPIPFEVERQALQQFKDQHYANWPDTKLPALGGKTPREALRTPEGRRKVEALLRDFENGEERNRKEGRPAYDFSKLRHALGLEKESR